MAAEDEGRTEEPSEYKLEKARKEGIVTQTRQFSAHMMVDLTNDGPVTIEINTKDLKI